MSQMIQEQFSIGGMTCQNCERHIREALLALPGVRSARVSYRDGSAQVEYRPQEIPRQALVDAVEEAGYTVSDGAARQPAPQGQVVGIALLVLALYMLLRHFGLMDYLNGFPTAELGMSYGMLFVIGLLTSVHCIAMCGGINLSQCVPFGAGAEDTAAALRPGLLYNAGRVVSYTAVGALAGALGSVISFSGAAKGVVQLVAGAFMVIMGVNMLGLFPSLRRLVPRLPASFTAKILPLQKGAGPLAVGLLNGLMPCGPLQAMQLYALSTGHPVKGALSMLLFSLGTVPLMLGLSAFSSILSKRFAKRMVTAGAVLVAVLGVSMFRSGLALSGGGLAAAPASAAQSAEAIPAQNGVQVVNTELYRGGYEPITVRAGIPVQWTITAQPGTINGCNNRLFIPEYGIEKKLEVGENLIEFTPAESGVYRYSCWMGMIRSTITVTDGDGALPEDGGESDSILGSIPSLYPAPPFYGVATDSIAVAQAGEEAQAVVINLEDQRFSPAVVVLQRGIPAEWTIVNPGVGFDTVQFPLQNAQMWLGQGENTISLTPGEDFDFWAGDGSFFGFVKVVDDIGDFDADAVIREAQGYDALYRSQNDDSALPACCR